MFFQSALFGLGISVMFLIIKLINFPKTPIPLYVINAWGVSMTTIFMIVFGVVNGHWGELVLKLLFTYIGIGFILYVSGDFGYYRGKFVKRREEQQRSYAPEDDPNWSTYRRNK